MKRRIAKAAVVLAILGGVVAYWTTGNMDPALSQWGLNYTECAQNGLGNWFCGDALKRMEREARKAKRESDAIDRRYEESTQNLADEGNPYAQEEMGTDDSASLVWPDCLTEAPRCDAKGNPWGGDPSQPLNCAAVDMSVPEIAAACRVWEGR